MIIPSFKSRFEVLKANGDHIQYVLDIGAYRGDGNKNMLLVDSISDITERKSCHLNDLF